NRVRQNLIRSGIGENEISVIGSRAQAESAGVTIHEGESRDEGASEPAKGALAGGVTGLALGLLTLAIPGVGPLVAAGPVAAGLTGAGLGAATGGLIGAFNQMGVPEEDAETYQESIRRG